MGTDRQQALGNRQAERWRCCAILSKPHSGHQRRAKDQRDDEQIVEGEGFFDEESGEVKLTRLRSHLPGDKTGKAKAKRDVKGGKPKAFANAHGPVFFVEKTKVQEQKPQDQGQKEAPHPQRRAQKRGE